MAVLDRAVSTRDSASQVCKSATNPTSLRTLSKLEKTTVQGGSRTLVYFEGCLGKWSYSHWLYEPVQER
jgi:hypothetical protein